jgi:hypothetical protein
MALRYRPLLISLLAIVALLAVAQHAGASPAASVAQSPDYQVPVPPAQPAPTPYLTPIPIVRLVGSISGKGSRIKMLSITSPRGSKVTVRCAGGRRKGCPYSRKAVTSPKKKKVRFRSLERFLKTGVVLRVYVTRGNTVGKYTSFKVRRNKAPARNDACLYPGDPTEPRGCS